MPRKKIKEACMNKNSLKCLLFDLDGTLLQWNSEAFLDEYFRTIAGYASLHMEPKRFIQLLLASTQEMIRNQDSQLTNQQVFEEHFLKSLGIEKEIIWPSLDRFYEEAFPKLGKHAYTNPLPRQIVEAALDKGYRVVLATNPVFPRAAMDERVRWAGLDGLPFEWMTTYEESHYCKPSEAYYREIAEHLGVIPVHCMMIGNDMQEDMIASSVGMKTFWVTDQGVNREDKQTYSVDASGTLTELLEAIRDGKGIFEPRKS
jgi:FMN phosphatase YigB (HAD superfamily)